MTKNNRTATKRVQKTPTVYIIDLTTGSLTTANKVKLKFIKLPDEIRWDFCNSSREYIFQMERSGQCVVVKNNGYIVSNKVITPKQYGETLKINIPSNITVAQFDEIVSDRYNLWNYPLSEYKHIVENNLKVVVVKFKSGECRFVEVKQYE